MSVSAIRLTAVLLKNIDSKKIKKSWKNFKKTLDFF